MQKIILLLLLSFLIITNCSSEEETRIDETDYLDAALPSRTRVEVLLNKMTLEEKIGQMTQVDKSFLIDISHINEYKLGSLLSGGGSTPSVNSPSAWADMYDEYQTIALGTRLGIPLIYGIDAVHGHNNVKGATIFPHNIGLGCTRNPELIRRASEVTASEVAATGIDWTFSPCIAVPRDERWGRTYEGFGETSELAEMMAYASVIGYQGSSLSDPTAILACAKHYIGDGGTYKGNDQGDTRLSEESLRSIHLPGYIEAINAGVGSIMASYNSWNGQKLHGHSYLINDVLKTELRFEGFVVSDWSGIDQLPGDYKDDIEKSINAGIDMIMVPQNYIQFITNLKELVEENRVTIERINDAVSRILRIKFDLGLFEHPMADRSLLSLVGSQQHRDIARQCVRESIVLLKNDNILPLRKDISKIHLAGKNVHDIGAQCGGWTISWQGSRGDITDGTTIYEGIRQTVESSTNVTLNFDGYGAEGSDAAIAVIGESPYAEGNGDVNSLQLSQEDINVVRNLYASGVPVIVVLITGRPLLLGSIIDYCDAILVAWLPGTEGAGVADVIFGDYYPTGKLSHSWPRSDDQIPINWLNNIYDPLFEYGFGLSY